MDRVSLTQLLLDVLAAVCRQTPDCIELLRCRQTTVWSCHVQPDPTLCRAAVCRQVPYCAAHWSICGLTSLVRLGYSLPALCRQTTG